MKAIVSILAALLVVCCPAGTALAVSYTITDLGTLGGTRSHAYGINDSGQVVGQADTASGAQHAFFYGGGVMADLGTLGGTSSCALGINNSGQVVGKADTGGSPPPPPSGQQPYYHAFLYNGDSLQDLGTVAGYSYSVATGINGDGQIVGYAAEPVSMYGSHAFVRSGGTMQDLGTFGLWFSSAAAINTGGQIVGSYGDFLYPPGGPGGWLGPHAFLYAGGTMRDLATLLPIGLSEVNGINAVGQVVGAVEYADPSSNKASLLSRAFLYSNDSMTDLGTLGGQSSVANALNDIAQVVGWSNTSDGNKSAFLYTSGTLLDLNNLIPAGSGWRVLEASAINNLGQIVGYGTNPSGQPHAFLATPTNITPEPSTLALLGAGGLILLCYAWWRRNVKATC